MIIFLNIQLLRSVVNFIITLVGTLYADVHYQSAWLRIYFEFFVLFSSCRIFLCFFSGNDYIGAVKLKKKHAQLLHEMDKLRPQYEETLEKADELMLSDHFAKDAIGKEKEKLTDRWRNLEIVADNRSRDLDNSIKAHDYFLEANECENWIKERQNNLDAKVGLKWPNNIDALMVIKAQQKIHLIFLTQ